MRILEEIVVLEEALSHLRLFSYCILECPHMTQRREKGEEYVYSWSNVFTKEK